jgi:hypothetical protein
LPFSLALPDEQSRQQDLVFNSLELDTLNDRLRTVAAMDDPDGWVILNRWPGRQRHEPHGLPCFEFKGRGVRFRPPGKSRISPRKPYSDSGETQADIVTTYNVDGYLLTQRGN